MEELKKPAFELALQPGGPKDLKLSCKHAFKNTTLAYKGATLGTFPKRSNLRMGKQFKLPDDSNLDVGL